jgi:hypothetical protein
LRSVLRRRRRIREGAITDDPDTRVDGEAGEAGDASSDKLAEIHAQETRLSVPAEALRRRVHAQMPPGDTTRRHVAEWGALGGAVGAAPRTSLGRGRWSLPDASPAAPLLAEETAAAAANRLVAERALAAGTRALFYGSALAVVSAVAASFLAADAYGITDEAAMRRVAAEAVAPRALALRGALQPFKAWLAENAGFLSSPFSGGGGADGESDAFVSQLRRTGAFRSLVAARDEQRERLRHAEAAADVEQP